ncbi:L-rhamnose mutarotase [Schaalia sp. ZJ405]|uniref:L-rhamnose mutarotase n=1 Tax=unclassified Schaalia TaxID=2691889 RepID=UPI0013EB4471|nr:MULTISPECIES: L-rhamnose mutarotase [unclassified Schaalia]QPK82340.1 L-rhamnose mutarotase [Schaalia sp. ZJ405]
MTQTPSLRETLDGTEQASPTRQCFLLRVRPEKLAEYADVHQRVWEEMREALSASGWRNYSLFLEEDTGMVVGYFESDDVHAAQEAMARTEVNTRWQAAMAQYFQPGGGGHAQILPQYFYLE